MLKSSADAGRASRSAAKLRAHQQIKQGFRFGRFELDVRARELRKDHVRIRLQDQPYEVLSMLLRQPGELLTREELRQRLWPDGTFVDFEHGLNAAVKRLRAVIGDSAERPRFIETLHRRGYRFIAPVERIGLEQIDADVAGGAADRKRRLAVLPFADLGDMDGHAYFSEGLTEEMITELGRLCADHVGVLARTSSVLVLRTASTAAEIGQALRVDYIIQGSVRRDGERVRIAAQLIETRGAAVGRSASATCRTVSWSNRRSRAQIAHSSRSGAEPRASRVDGRAHRRPEASKGYHGPVGGEGRCRRSRISRKRRR